MIRFFTGLVVALLCAATSHAQFPAVGNPKPANPKLKIEIQKRWYKVPGDSVLVEYALPATAKRRPCVIVLSDRFGLRESMRASLRVLAQMGFRAYAIPLRSAPGGAVEGIPPVTIDTADFAIVTQVAIDIRNDPDGTGHLGLLAFDVGATIGARCASRIPLFKSCMLFYPFNQKYLNRFLADISVPLMMNIGEFDGDYTLSVVNEMREAFMDKKKMFKVNFYKGSRPFFFNREHANFHKKNWNTAWTETLKFFSENL